MADLLKLLLKIRAREIDVASRLLTRADEMEALAAGTRKNLKVLEGWRYDVFGRDALELVEGKLGFTVKQGKLVMTHVDDAASGADDGADDEDEAAAAGEDASE